MCRILHERHVVDTQLRCKPATCLGWSDRQEVDEAQADALYAAFHDGSIMTGAGGPEIEVTRQAAGSTPSSPPFVTWKVYPACGRPAPGRKTLCHCWTLRTEHTAHGRPCGCGLLASAGPAASPPRHGGALRERFWSWPDVAWWIGEHLHLTVEVAPEPIRLADEVLKARQAVAEAQQILGAAEDAT